MSIENKVTWVTVADSNTCRIYNFDKKSNQLNLIKEISHLENKKRDIDSTKEAKISDYLKEVADVLEHGRSINAYKQLIVIALPHENGLLLQNMNSHVKDLIIYNIQKNAVQLSSTDLIDFLQKNTDDDTENN